jgi:hypothetical protein
VLVDLPSNRESEFRVAIGSMGGSPGSPTPATAATPAGPEEPRSTPSATMEKKSFVVQIVEAASKRD